MKTNQLLIAVLFILTISFDAFSQYHFEIQHSINDITAQRSLFKNAKAETATITGKYFDEKVSFDIDGKIINSISYQSGDEDAFDGKTIYEYDSNGNLIMIRYESGDANEPKKLFYDINGNVVKDKDETYEEEYTFDADNKITGSNLLSQNIEKLPIESIEYENNFVKVIKYKCWNEGVNAPFAYTKTEYNYDDEQKVIRIINIDGNCKTGKEEISSKTLIEYNEMNLPVRYITKDINGGEEINSVSYKYFN